eukprot:Rhum_TRINITY_DN16489_c0_g1::Rhum_TRINITY_DN16489_c0_g1_i1::g.163334::m.163334
MQHSSRMFGRLAARGIPTAAAAVAVRPNLAPAPAAPRPLFAAAAAAQARSYCTDAATTALEIELDHTPNPDCVKFTPFVSSGGTLVLMPDGVILDISSSAHTNKSALSATIFEVTGVLGVCLGDTWLTVTKSEDTEWEELSPLVIEAINKWHASGEPVTSDEYFDDDDTEIDESFDTEVVQAIKELVKTRIRPGVQQDGGNIKYIGFEDGVVMLLMQGACQSCPSSGATLKQGIEKMMMHWIPEVVEVRAVEDDFANEYIAEMAEMKKKYKLEGDRLVPRDQPPDDDLMSQGI